MMIRPSAIRTWTRGWPGQVTLFLALSYLLVSCVTLIVSRLFISYRPSGPANPAAFIYRLFVPGGAQSGDSWNAMIAALHVLQGPAASRLYETLFFGLKTKFQYPPSSILPLKLLSIFFSVTPRLLNAINSIVVVVLFIGLMAIAVIIQERRVSRKGWRLESRHLLEVAVPVAIGIGTFYPVLRALQLGQIQLWIDALFVWACVCFMGDRKAAAGSLLGLAFLIKPQLGLFLVWALVWREYRMCVGFLLLAIPIEIVTLLAFGFHNDIAYLKVLSFISQHGEVFYPNQSVNGLVNRLLSNGNSLIWQAHSFAPFNRIVYLTTTVTGVVFLLIPLIGAFFASRQARTVDLGLAALCFTMASPVVWEHHYGIALPVFLFTLASILQHPPSVSRQARLVVLAAAWCLVSSFLPWLNVTAPSGANILQSYTFLGALLLVIATALETASGSDPGNRLEAPADLGQATARGR